MIESIEFKNFKVLKDAKLPLGPFTLIVGANGSGKSTALQGLIALRDPKRLPYAEIASVGTDAPVQMLAHLGGQFEGDSINCIWKTTGGEIERSLSVGVGSHKAKLNSFLSRVRVFSLNPSTILKPAVLHPQTDLSEDGGGLAVVLDQLRDNSPERFEALNREFAALFPEFDRILFVTHSEGTRSIKLRTRIGHYVIPALNLSHGTLVGLAILTLAYLPEPPPVIGIEEPERAIHPRLLRQLRDAFYRLSHPDCFDESRQPVQVIATTQSPYFLDQYTDHPEEIVVAEKVGLEAKFHRLMDRPDMEEILGDVPLGDAWYSGVLGGVPSRT
ncbi:MAG: AAA family ATPase [Planctomycetia bacterium]|nr:AAA family ATPase [Planctomycetia bacterium]